MPIAFRPATVLSVVLIVASATAAAAGSDPYHITAYEKAVCTSDAARLCADAYPDEHRLLGCMKSQRSSLTSICKVAFNAGLKRRHIE